MDEAIYLNRGGEQTGPIDTKTLEAMLTEGTVSPNDLVWRDGMTEWVPLSDLFHLETVIENTSDKSDPIQARKKNTSSGTPLWIKLVFLLSLTMIFWGVARKSPRLVQDVVTAVYKTPQLVQDMAEAASKAPQLVQDMVEAVSSDTPSSDFLSSPIYFSAEGHTFPPTTKNVQQMITDANPGTKTSWSHEEDDSWILSVTRHDPLINRENEIRLQFSLVDGKVFLTRGTTNAKLMSVDDILILLAAFSGELHEL